MANISKAERERRAAEAPDNMPSKSHLVELSKGGETIKVHPTCVANHKQLGWKQA